MMIAIGILLFALLVIVHEFGHFWTARRNGVEVEEFGIGFPPRLYGKQTGGTLYSINALPLGGFVKMKGEADSDRREGSFGAASLWVKTKILLAGVGMNLLAAFVILLVLALTQMPTLMDGQYQVSSDQKILDQSVSVAQVRDGSPAAEAGITDNSTILEVNETAVNTPEDLQKVAGEYQGKAVTIRYENVKTGEVKTSEITLGSPKPGYLGVGLSAISSSEGVPVDNVSNGSAAEEIGIETGDRIVSVEGEDVTSSGQLTRRTSELAGETVMITYLSDGETRQEKVQLGTGGAIQGATILPFETSRYTWAAPVVALGLTVQMVGLVLAAVGDIITSLLAGAGAEAAEDVAGPVGIIFLLQNMGDLGIAYLFILVASISVSLAVFNALPIPALDGGRLAVIAGARALKKRLSETVESSIHGIGFMALIGLLLLITYVDVQRFF